MKLVTYEIEQKVKLGALSSDEKWIYPLSSMGIDYRCMQELIENISESELQLAQHYCGQGSWPDQRSGSRRGSEASGADSQSASRCNLPGSELHGPRRGVGPL